MAPKKIDRVGFTTGKLTVIAETDPWIDKKGRKTARWLCQCKCGTTTKVSSSRLKRVKSCGCDKTALQKASKKHGDANNGNGVIHYLYSTYHGIKYRCNNPKAPEYKNYGGRGITMCNEWEKDYLAFKNYILNNLGERPEGKTLDRINTNGNYEPGNLRWATQSIQVFNQRAPKSKSGIPGVYQSKNREGWNARITHQGKRIYLGYFLTQKEAIKARNDAENKYFT